MDVAMVNLTSGGVGSTPLPSTPPPPTLLQDTGVGSSSSPHLLKNLALPFSSPSPHTSYSLAVAVSRGGSQGGPLSHEGVTEVPTSSPPAARGKSPQGAAANTNSSCLKSAAASTSRTAVENSTIVDSSTSDVEKFDGRILYNPDGSAYIIEDSEMSDEEGSLDLSQLKGCIVDGRGVNNQLQQVIPQIANAFYVTRNPSLYSALYANLLQEKNIVPEVPIMHSYRVYTVRDKSGDSEHKVKEEEKSCDANSSDNNENINKVPMADYSSVPIKPILMCFICKLSFGYAKPFVSHAMGDHNLVLTEEEKSILGQKNTSAIIQSVGKDKEPLVSFLEPISPIIAPATGRKYAHLTPKNLFNNIVSENIKINTSGMSNSSDDRKSPAAQLRPSSRSISLEEEKHHDSEMHTYHPPTSRSLPGSATFCVPTSTPTTNINPFSILTGNKTPTGLMDLSWKSPGVSGGGSGRSSASPGTRSVSPTPTATTSPPAMSPYQHSPGNFLTGTTIGVCPEHMNGRPSGVDCAKCEMILNASRLGGLAGLHSRNSCKTLKCPKCNWHYKYQETLEIHMKEKHPENETSCIYCIAGQPHPRLARGETYTCGYKPYRCEVCNYSTTTKGNLSIHMQSDKHLNNMQELQNGGTIPTESSSIPHPPKSIMVSSSLSPSASIVPVAQPNPKPKPTFRCDVCNYETNVARNLRIHMTSEKHTHNMMVLQQNVKHMQHLSALQQAQSQMNFDASLFQLHPSLTGLSAEKQAQHPEAALADMAYNQALLIQMMTGGQLPPHIPPELSPHMDLGLNPDTMDPPPEPPDPNPTSVYHCCVCNGYSTENLEVLSHHITQDRTKLREQEILMVVAGHYICKLCSYKTNLKANFQLHCKTDKHLQRLQHVNHIKEGGPRNEWKLKYLNVSNPVQVRCNACDYYTNSTHKLQIHATHQRHEVSTMLFRHLQKHEAGIPEESRLYHCVLCIFSSRTKLQLLQHVRSMKHLQMEQLHQLQRRAEGKESHAEMGDVFCVIDQSDVDTSTSSAEGAPESKEVLRIKKEYNTAHQQQLDKDSMLKNALEKELSAAEANNDLNSATSAQQQGVMCPYCNYTCNSEMRMQAHVVAQHSANISRDIPCPLCQDAFKDKNQLEKHVMQVHSVNADGLQRLLLLVDQSHWLNSVSRQSTSTPQPTTNHTSTPPNIRNSIEKESEEEQEREDEDHSDAEELRCHLCSKLFRHLDELYQHQSELGHLEIKQTPSGPGYLCWKKGCNQYFPTAPSLQMHFKEIHAQGHQVAVSEKHVYKYRCNQCSLAFKTMEKLQLHSQYHIIRDATKCALCGRSFRSLMALQKHVETSHSELTEDEIMQYKQALSNNPLVIAGLSGQVLDPAINEFLRREGMREGIREEEDEDGRDDMKELDRDDAFMSNEGPDGDGENSNDSSSYKEQQFLEDYLNSQAIAEDSYNDPNRKYKCHRCKVAFTRQSYLTSHNKTLMHRKGEKLSYPMEKYLDPNRPYKCDVCKESFTQKNILLVHYNSVSHLHKLKRAMQDQQSNLGSSNLPPPPLPMLPQTNGSIIPTNNILGTPTKSSDDDDKKPYKCNICKVAYSQGSTLDIHMRSVLHQTRASKLQELAMTGQIDLSKPLIEQPESQKIQDQHKKLIQDILGTKSSVNATSPVSSIISHLGTPVSQSTPNSSSSQNKTQQNSPVSLVTQPQSLVTCQRCSAIFVSQEQLLQHQQLYCLFPNSLGNLFPNIPTSSAGVLPSPVSTSTPVPAAQIDQSESLLALTKSCSPSPVQMEDYSSLKFSMPTKKSSQIYKHLLESYGFEVVMQFNEYHQKRIKKEVTEDTFPEVKMELDSPVETEEKEPQFPSLPEITKSVCEKCKKEFSSVWVLKSHCEEIHKKIVPLEFLEKYADDYKNDYDKKSGNTTATTATSISPVAQQSGQNNTSGMTSTPEKDVCEEKAEQVSKVMDTVVTNTSPSTPTASSTPASSTESIPCAVPTSKASSLSNLPMSLAQQMNEMQAALSAMAASQLQQLQFNPMMMSMAGLGMGLPLGLNMPALAAMNLQPPLVPMMMPPPFDHISGLSQAQASSASPMYAQSVDPNVLTKQQQQMMQQQQTNVTAASQQKRARTRITDDQLKILRAHFDINNSPSEDQISEMASQSGLPPKVIKHWFRNTLFKERQRNKDSPYNFSNPPSTSLNLEEYEKTGETKVVPVQHQNNQKKAKKEEVKPEVKHEVKQEVVSVNRWSPSASDHSSHSAVVKQEKNDTDHGGISNKHVSESPLSLTTNNPPIATESVPATRSSSPGSLTLTSIITSQLSAETQILNCSGTIMLPPPILTTTLAPTTTHSFTSSQIPCTSIRSLSPSFPSPIVSRPENLLQGIPCSGAPFSPVSSTSSSGKRANRTRFTDYQIKVLQEFFENNAYPKDDDLEYLSKLLNLSPRVIVVWFQNARQKARKVYENQPPVDTPAADESAGRFQRTPGLNYQCKKCLLVFQRYYELIRHQKTHCFKEEDAKRSAQAQAAAAQIAAAMSSEDSNSSTITESASSTTGMLPSGPASNEASLKQQDGSFQCDKCNLVFPRFDLWREHQLVHIMNPNLFPSYPPDSPFGILQQQAHLQQQQQIQQEPLSPLEEDPPTLLQSPPGMDLFEMTGAQKRKWLEELEDDKDEQPRDKRLRTTILPEQLDYLYQKYQVESNPSRKMLENIAREVGLKKRVVQVWFQNTRARERKGQFRAHSQVINKRCPFCPALFKVKSALESHLTTKHADQYIKGEINIDSLPDEEVIEHCPSFSMGDNSKVPTSLCASTSPSSSIVTSSLVTPLFPPLLSSTMTENVDLKKFYEDSLIHRFEMAQAAAAVTATSHNGKDLNSSTAAPTDLSMKQVKQENDSGTDAPLDLSKPIKGEHDHHDDMTGILGSYTVEWSRSNMDDQDSMSEGTDGPLMMDFDESLSHESNPASPASSTQSQRPLLASGKRFRTQMSSVQVKVMKNLFHDYKTPTMAECEMLGREIGLPKRVIQVWFQNARAKEKKHKLALQKTLGQDLEPTRPPEECMLCSFKYSHKYSIQDHIFSKRHIESVRSHIERCKTDHQGKVMTSFPAPPPPPPLENNSVNTAEAATMQNGCLPSPPTGLTPSQQQLAHLQMLQMAAAAGLGLPTTMKMDPAAIMKDVDAVKNLIPGVGDDLNLLQQLYSLGIPGFPPHQNPLLQSVLLHSGNGNGGQQLPITHETSLPTSGTPLSLLQLPALLQKEAITRLTENTPGNNNNTSGDSLRFSADGKSTLPESPSPLPRGIVEREQEAVYVCRKCRLTFPTTSSLSIHQRAVCYTGRTQPLPPLRLVQISWECAVCSERFSNLSGVQMHCQSESHVSKVSSATNLFPPPSIPTGRPPALSPSSGLSSEMEDVVKQLTALARAAGQRQSPTIIPTDPNGNIRPTKDSETTDRLIKLEPVATTAGQ